MMTEKNRPFPFIDLQQQYRRLKTEVDARIHAVLDHGQYILGPEVTELEAKLAARVGVAHCISCSSGTDALLLALMAVGVCAGDEVVTSPFTFFATGEMISLLGAVPVMVDIEPGTYNIDAGQIERAITEKTRAIMPVSLYGQPAEMDAINEIAARHRLPVIEDAAQSFGSTYKGRQSCGLSTVGCTSFFPSKPLGGYGDGGACFTDDPVLAKAMSELRTHGQAVRYQHSRIGINGRLDTLQAAILLAKLTAFDEELEGRERAAGLYFEALRPLAEAGVLRLPEVREDRTCVWAQFTVAVEGRAEVVAALHAAGVPTAVHYPVPMHKQPVYAGLGLSEGSLPVSEHAAAHVLSLPMHPYLGEGDVERVAEALAGALMPVLS